MTASTKGPAMRSRFCRRPVSWWQRLAAAAAVLAAVAWPVAAGAGQFTARPLPSRPGNIYVNIAVSQTRVWVFANARTNAPGSIAELNKATGRQIGTLRE